jgi:uncharacterized protein YcbK (DUF882 family)
MDNSRMISNPITKTALLALCLAPTVTGAGGDKRILSFYHTHTGEELEVKYYENGDYRPEGLQQIDSFLADWRNAARHNIDPALMDILWRIQLAGQHNGTWEVISAYRSPETNNMLRSKSNGVASKSQHIEGKAIDVRLRGMDTKQLHAIALELQLGGVGYYGKSDFIHVDTGRVRRW